MLHESLTRRRFFNFLFAFALGLQLFFLHILIQTFRYRLNQTLWIFINENSFFYWPFGNNFMLRIWFFLDWRVLNNSLNFIDGINVIIVVILFFMLKHVMIVKEIRAKILLARIMFTIFSQVLFQWSNFVNFARIMRILINGILIRY